MLDTLFRPLRGFEGERDLLATDGMIPDQSVFDRLEARSDYRPKNLLRYLRAHPSCTRSFRRRSGTRFERAAERPGIRAEWDAS